MVLKKLAIAPLLLLFFVTGCSVDSAKNRYLLAEKLWTEANYPAAVSEFERVVQKDPKGKLGLQALYRAGITQAVFLQQYNEGVSKLQRFVELNTDPQTNWDALLQIGDILFSKLERYEDAITHYKELLRKNPKATEAADLHFRIAKANFYLWRFPEALRLFQELQGKFPKSQLAEQAAYHEGLVHFTQGGLKSNDRSREIQLYEKAREAFEEFMMEYPGSSLVSEAKFGIASCYEELDQLDLAFQKFEEIQNTYPSPKVIAIKLFRLKERKAQKGR